MKNLVNERIWEKVDKPSAIKNIMSSDFEISFGGGWGGHHPPIEIEQSLSKLVSDPEMYFRSTRYSDIRGSRDFRKSIVEFERDQYQRNLTEDEIIIGQGSTELTASLFKVLLEDNDRVILFDPSYANFKTQILNENQSVEIVSIPVIQYGESELESRININKTAFIEEYRKCLSSERIKFTIICNPDNPTSLIWDDDVVLEMIRISYEYSSWFIMDLSYSNFYFSESQPVSFTLDPEEFNNLIIINSFSKNFSLLGFRIGYIAAHGKLTELIEYVESTRNLSPNTIIQNSLNQYLTYTSKEVVKKYLSDRRESYKKVSGFLCEILRTYLKDLIILKPQGGFYVLVSFKEYGITNTVRFSADLLEETGILIVPGVDFGETTKDTVRLSFAPLIENMEKIETGVSLISDFINKNLNNTSLLLANNTAI